MKKTDAIEYFRGVTELARTLGIQRCAIYQWGERVPEKRAAQLDRITRGKLKYRITDYAA